MLKRFILLVVFTIGCSAHAQDLEFIPLEVQVSDFTTGTLLAPNQNIPVPLIIIIQDSGNINEDGNQPYAKNDVFKHLANELAKEGIASYRYNKRVLQMRKLEIKEEDMRFEDFVSDALQILEYFKNQERFSKIVIAGHGEGSLIGMMAAKKGADGFISIAGAGEPIQEVIVKQIEEQIPGLKENAATAFNEMLENGSTSNYSKALESIFRPNVQPFMLSWMKFNPSEEIQKLEIPILLINGNKNLQVKEEQTHLLKTAKPESELIIIPKMNHVLRIIEGDDLENAKSFNEPLRPIATRLIEAISDFVKNKV